MRAAEPARLAPVRALVALGANLGDARATLRAAGEALAHLPSTQVIARSSLYRTAPVEATGPDFYNAVVCLKTGLAALDLLDALQAIELDFGRQRPFRNAPRTLDLDVLTYGDEQLHSDRLTIPHPRLHQRAFVLRPLLDVAPDLIVPGIGAAQACLPGVADQGIERVGGTDW